MIGEKCQSGQCASDCGMARLAYFAAAVLRLTFSGVKVVANLRQQAADID